MKIFRHWYYKFFCKKQVKKHAHYKRDKYEDRNVLEEIIIPYILGYHNPKTILDIGREDYQHFYNKFFINRELWTIDYNTEHKDFGSKNHIIDDVANLKNHFDNNKFDLIIFNGVFGWGLNKEESIEKTFSAVYDILKPNGILIFGWNDIKDLTPLPLDEIKSLKKFKPFYFKPLKNETFKCINGEHTYNFFIK